MEKVSARTSTQRGEQGTAPQVPERSSQDLQCKGACVPASTPPQTGNHPGRITHPRSRAGRADALQPSSPPSPPPAKTPTAHQDRDFVCRGHPGLCRGHRDLLVLLEHPGTGWNGWVGGGEAEGRQPRRRRPCRQKRQQSVGPYTSLMLKSPWPPFPLPPKNRHRAGRLLALGACRQGHSASGTVLAFPQPKLHAAQSATEGVVIAKEACQGACCENGTACIAAAVLEMSASTAGHFPSHGGHVASHDRAPVLPPNTHRRT